MFNVRFGSIADIRPTDCWLVFVEANHTSLLNMVGRARLAASKLRLGAYYQRIKRTIWYSSFRRIVNQFWVDTMYLISGYWYSEGAVDAPIMPLQVIFADYLAAYVGSAAVAAALYRRSIEGGSYQIRVSLTRMCMWAQEIGLLDASALGGALPFADIVKQTNIAQGHQQVNNLAEKNITPQNELLKDGYEELDTGTTTTPKGVDTTLEALGKINGRKNTGR